MFQFLINRAQSEVRSNHSYASFARERFITLLKKSLKGYHKLYVTKKALDEKDVQMKAETGLFIASLPLVSLHQSYFRVTN